MRAPIRTEAHFEKINNLLQFHTYSIILIGNLQIRDLVLLYSIHFLIF